jgi:flagellar hook-basal body complex protein FliE
MDVTALSSLNSLGATARSAQPAPVAGAAGAGPSFTDMLGQIVSAGVNTIEGGESAAIQGLSGAAPPFKVVEAVMAAQRTLQEGLSIRDKVVSAYQEISRMAI